MPASNALTENITRKVRNQYEDYPYPHRDPMDELKELRLAKIDCMDAINHYCYGGTRDYRKGFRALVAGGGTGDSAVAIAEQFHAHPNCELTYVDLSSTSMAIAKERIKVRGLEKDNIRWIQGSLLDLRQMDVGKFDYINCSGVLHHLPDPDAGLASLHSVLADDGCMGIMVYGEYGRTGVYQMQELMQRMHSGAEHPIEERIKDTWETLNRLPNTNHFIKDAKRWMGELNRAKDVAIYDIFLHPQDRAYTVPQLYEWLENEGLKLIDFVGGGTVLGKATYDPRSFYPEDSAVTQKLSVLPLREQQAIAELIVGSLRKHIFYAGNKGNTRASFEDEANMIPAFSTRFADSLYKTTRAKAVNASASDPFTFEIGNQNIAPPHPAILFTYFDGNRTMAEIIDAMAADDRARLTKEQARQILHQWCLDGFNFDMVYLRHKSIPPYTHYNGYQGKMAG